MTGPFTDRWLSMPGYRHLGHLGCQEDRRGGHSHASLCPRSPLVRPVGSPPAPASCLVSVTDRAPEADSLGPALSAPLGGTPLPGAGSPQPWRLLPLLSGRTHALPPTQRPGTGLDTRLPCTPATAGHRAKPSRPGAGVLSSQAHRGPVPDSGEPSATRHGPHSGTGGWSSPCCPASSPVTSLHPGLQLPKGVKGEGICTSILHPLWPRCPRRHAGCLRAVWVSGPPRGDVGTGDWGGAEAEEPGDRATHKGQVRLRWHEKPCWKGPLCI